MDYSTICSCKKMSHHTRSNSLPSKSHPAFEDFEARLDRLKCLQGTLLSASSICANLDHVSSLYESINSLVNLPSVQQALALEAGENWASELLDRSLGLLDSCGIARDALVLVKESVQDLESSLRRRRRGEVVPDRDIDSFLVTRKKVVNMIKSCIKNMRTSKQEHRGIITGKLIEAEVIGFSVLKSVLLLVCGERVISKQRTWGLVSKFTHLRSVRLETDQQNDDQMDQEFNVFKVHKSVRGIDAAVVPDLLKLLKDSKMAIQEIEEGLESLFRNLIKQRVSLLNVISL